MPQIARPWSWQSLAPGGILGRTTTAISGAMPSSRLGAGSINGLIKKSAVKDKRVEDLRLFFGFNPSS